VLDWLARFVTHPSTVLPAGAYEGWPPAALALSVTGNALMALSYASIPLALFTLVRRRRDFLASNALNVFLVFVLLVTASRVLLIWAVWQPAPWLEAGVTFASGVAAALAASLMWPLIPKALRIPSINQLQAAIARLETEAVERRRAEARLAQVNTDLERRILERTRELEREVAERTRLQDADRARQAAELASSAKSEFLSRMSHELRTPLNAVLGFAQLSRRALDDGDAPRTHGYLQHIEDGGWHLVRMIDDILDISRIEQGRQSYTLSAVDLGPVVAEAAAMVQPLASSQQVSFVNHLPDMPPPVRADRTRLIQVMTNLISNATKFNRPGGEVHVSLAEPCADGQVCIEVRDTGLGMSPAQLAQLFQPFNRLGRERQGIPGTGIGLVLVRHLVEQMGGGIEVQSAEGEGSRFTVQLPADAPVAQDDSREAAIVPVARPAAKGAAGASSAL
jgi:signal transduction histidine kinase